jgi:hypothetical protein
MTPTLLTILFFAPYHRTGTRIYRGKFHTAGSRHLLLHVEAGLADLELALQI